MTKRLPDIKRQHELQRLIDEQSDDLSSTILFPEMIRPMRPRVLEGLKAKEKAALILSLIGSMTSAEIGEAINCNESAVRYYKTTGYKKLRAKYCS